MHTVSWFQVKHLSGENRCMYTHADLQNWQKEPSTEKSLLLSVRTAPEPQQQHHLLPSLLWAEQNRANTNSNSSQISTQNFWNSSRSSVFSKDWPDIVDNSNQLCACKSSHPTLWAPRQGTYRCWLECFLVSKHLHWVLSSDSKLLCLPLCLAT